MYLTEILYGRQEGDKWIQYQKKKIKRHQNEVMHGESSYIPNSIEQPSPPSNLKS